jgi:predicted dehydrogenase
MGSNVENISNGKALPRFLIIGAGSRGNHYAQAIVESKIGVVASVADPIVSKRQSLGKRFIWGNNEKQRNQEFDSWQDYLQYEQNRRKQESSGHHVLPGFDGIFVCTLDHTHKEVITSLAPLNLHIMAEKPLATTLQDCIDIYQSVKPLGEPQTVFSIGHVLRYSPFNMQLRELLLEDKVIGDVLSIEHTEPVGWWHFSHSYVR